MSLEYNKGPGLLDGTKFKISPSQFSKFMERPWDWYREQILGESSFNGNTATVIGTIVHYCAEMKALDREPSKTDIEWYIQEQTKDNEDVDAKEVRKAYPEMAMRLVNDYVLKQTFTEVEPYVSTKLGSATVSGSIDAVQGSMIVDYKTYSSKVKPRVIPKNYRYQLLIYAWIMTQNEKPIDRIRLVYVNKAIDGGISEKTGKPLKSYPPEVTVLTESIGEEDLEFIESVLTICVETYDAAIDLPNIVHLLYKDMRLKEKHD